MAKSLNDLAAAGVSVWLDDLSRPRIRTGSLAPILFTLQSEWRH